MSASRVANRGTLNYASVTAVGNRTITLTGTVVVGNTLVGSLICNNGAANLPPLAVTDSKANAWTVDASIQNAGNLIVYVFSSPITHQLTTSDTITLTFSGPSSTRTGWAASIEEFTGLLTSSYIDQTAAAFGTSAGPSSGSTGITSNSSDLVFGAIGYGALRTLTVNGAFFNDSPVVMSGSSADRAITVGWRFVLLNSTYSFTGTLDAGGTWGAACVTYKAPVSNVSPTANAGPDQHVSAAAVVTLDGTASSDPDGSIASYAWAQTGGTSVTLSSSSASQPTFTAPSLSTTSTLTFQLTVTDNSSATGTDTVVITVDPIDLSTSVVEIGFTLATGTATSATLTLSQGVIAGHTVVLAAITDNAAGLLPTPTITDTRSNTYAVDNSMAETTNIDLYVASAHVGTALQIGDVITFSMGVNRTRYNLVAYDVPNIVTASRVDVLASNGGTTGTTLTTGATTTTTQANDFVFAVFGNTNARTYTTTAGWTAGTSRVTAAGSADREIQAEWYFPGSTGTQSATVTINSNSVWAALITAYKLNVSVAVPPTANAGLDKIVYPYDLVTLNGSGTAVNGATITGYAWTQTSGATQTLSSASVAAPTFSATATTTTQTLVFSLIVTDSNTTPSSADTVTITVLPSTIRFLSGGSWVSMQRKQLKTGSWIN